MDKKYSWTVDVEGDWGGRVNTYDGIDKGLPLIYKTFKRNNVKGLFFISTELLKDRPGVVSEIIREGHEIACHGHFHFCFDEPWRQDMNMQISRTILENYTEQTRLEYRAPKFSYTYHGHEYSDPKNHVSVLKHLWLGQRITQKSTFYLHPFDIVGGKNAPTLFSKWWYSKPRKAYETFNRLVHRYHGDLRLGSDSK